MYIFLIYFNPNNFVESGCGLEVSLFSYTPFLFLFYLLSVFFFFKKLTQFSFSTLNLYGLRYSSRKPIVYKPPASI